MSALPRSQRGLRLAKMAGTMAMNPVEPTLSLSMKKNVNDCQQIVNDEMRGVISILFPPSDGDNYNETTSGIVEWLDSHAERSMHSANPTTTTQDLHRKQQGCPDSPPLHTSAYRVRSPIRITSVDPWYAAHDLEPIFDYLQEDDNATVLDDFASYWLQPPALISLLSSPSDRQRQQSDQEEIPISAIGTPSPRCYEHYLAEFEQLQQYDYQLLQLMQYVSTPCLPVEPTLAESVTTQIASFSTVTTSPLLRGNDSTTSSRLPAMKCKTPKKHRPKKCQPQGQSVATNKYTKKKPSSRRNKNSVNKTPDPFLSITEPTPKRVLTLDPTRMAYAPPTAPWSTARRSATPPCPIGILTSDQPWHSNAIVSAQGLAPASDHSLMNVATT